jgi:hypothetical protein
MVFITPTHMPMRHDLPLAEFIGEVLIFAGLFIGIHAFLGVIKAGNLMSMFIGLIVVTIGCFVYVIMRDKKSSFDDKKMNNIYYNNESPNNHVRQYHTPQY